MIANGTIVNADVNAAAAIAGTKISPDFGSQAITTSGAASAASFRPTSNTAPANGLFLPTTNTLGFAVNSAEVARITASGGLAIGSTAANANVGIRQAKSITGGTTAWAQYIDGAVQTDVTVSAIGIGTALQTAASASLTSLIHYQAATGSLGAGTSITNQIGFSASSTLDGATNNYGFYGAIAAGTGNWNCFMVGTAPNYFNGQVQIGAGSITAPSVSTNGDTNTGVYFPAADTVGIVTGGSERFRLGPDGQIGLGGANYGTSGQVLTSNGSGSAPTWQTPAGGGDVVLASNNAFTGANTFTNSTGQTIRAAASQDGILLSGRAGGTNNYTVQIVPATLSASRVLSLPNVSGTVITSGDTGTVTDTMLSGNIAYSKLSLSGNIVNADISGSAAIAYSKLSLGSSITNTDIAGAAAIAGTKIAPVFGSQTIQTSSGNVVTTSGNVNVGSTATLDVGAGTQDGVSLRTASASGVLHASNTGAALAYFRRRTSDGAVIQFQRDTTAVGTISVTTTATAYNTSSDYRLKENVVPLTGAIDRVNQLQVHRFNFIADPDKTVDGFIAHEAQAVVPECVTGTKDEVDADGNPVYQGIDQSKLVPLLTAALQEALAQIESLKARVTALEP
jgi:hypothetical protein